MKISELLRKQTILSQIKSIFFPQTNIHLFLFWKLQIAFNLDIWKCAVKLINLHVELKNHISCYKKAVLILVTLKLLWKALPKREINQICSFPAESFILQECIF